MAFHVFLFLLVFLLFLGLALLWRLSWPHLQRSHSPARSRGALVHRLLKPRTQLDCPSVVSPRQVWNLPLRQYAPGVR